MTQPPPRHEFAQPELLAEEVWPEKSWNGYVDGLNVFRVMFPLPECAEKKTVQVFKNGKVVLFTVTYNFGVTAAIVMSTMPNGRSVQEEMSIQLNISESIEKTLGYDTHILSTSTDGRLLVKTSKKFLVIPPAEMGPYPLVHVVSMDHGLHSESMSAHRVFCLNERRFEIAVIQHLPLPQGANDEEFEEEGFRNASLVADALYASIIKNTLAPV